jgi:hypothetical protein
MPAIATRFVWSPVEDALYWCGRDEAASETTADAGSMDRLYRLMPSSRAGAQLVQLRGAHRLPAVVGTDATATLVRDLTSSSTQPGLKSHLRLLSRSRVVESGADTVVAIWTEAHPAGVLWWQPTFASDDTEGSVLGFGGGIRVWYAASMDATPTLLLHTGY